MKKDIIIIAMILLVLPLSLALPQIATEFYGFVFTHNGSLAPNGTFIEAYDSDSMLCGVFNTSSTGHYGLLSCRGDDSSTPIDEGALQGGAIRFFINGGTAYPIGNNSWGEGEYHEVNLTRNQAPVIQPIGNQTAYVNQTFVLQVIATDADNDTLNFSDNTNLFEIDNNTGLIIFTPSMNHVGVYTITIYVSDGFLTVSQDFVLTIERIPFCGDGICDTEYGETCENCPEDCGPCPPPPPEKEAPPAGAGGAGAPSAIAPEAGAAAKKKCKENWLCSDWSNCTPDGLQYRTCEDLNKCGTTDEKPNETQTCIYIGTCFDGIQNQGEEGIDCGGPCPPCPVRATCFDGIRNQGEEDIDCGGPCPPCVKLPKVEIPKPRIGCGDGVCIPGEECTCLRDCMRFPLWFVIIMAAIILSLILFDQTYKRLISRKKIVQYKKVRRRLYLIVINLSALTVVTTIFLYIFGSCLQKYWWILVIIIVATPIAVYRILKYYGYSEYRKRRREQKLLETHEKRIRELIKTQNKLFYETEKKVCLLIYDSAKNKEFENKQELYAEYKKFYSILAKLYKVHSISLKPVVIEEPIEKTIKWFVEDKVLDKLSKIYPEFNSVKQDLVMLYKNYLAKNEVIETENTLIEDIKAIAFDKQLIVVIQSRLPLVRIYNSLVDIYSYYKNKHQELAVREKEEIDDEKKFSLSFEKLATKGELMSAIKASPNFINIYNGFYDLNEHYKKREALYERILELRRTKKAEAAIAEREN